MAAERGLEVRETTTTSLARGHVNLITLAGGDHSIAATLVGVDGEPRIVLLDDHRIDVPPARNMLVVRNDDRQGVIGRVGTILGDAGINIDDMHVGRSPDGAAALMVVSTSEPVPAGVRDLLLAADGILSVGLLSR
jgi:D-3-phosphoglycerate dehydrogenase